MKNIYLCHFNLNSLEGVIDIINMLSSILKSRNINLILVKDLQIGKTNFLIEDFSKNCNIEYLVNFKLNNLYSQTKINCIITEFPGIIFNQFTFNPPSNLIYKIYLYFDIKIFYSKYLVNFFWRTTNIIFSSLFLFYTTYLICQSSFFKISSGSLDKSIHHIKTKKAINEIFLKLKNVFFTKKFFSYLNYLLRLFFRKTKSFIYLLYYPSRRSYYILKFIRFQNFIKVSPYIDKIVSMHPASNENQIWNKFNISLCHYFTPEISLIDFFKSINKSSNIIIFTGNLTSYRKRKIRSLTQEFLNNGFYIKFSNSYIIDNKIDFSYSLCIKQSHDWYYSSPGRIWRAYSEFNAKPLLLDRFNDHPIEAICISNVTHDNLRNFEYENLINSFSNYYSFANINNNSVLQFLDIYE